LPSLTQSASFFFIYQNVSVEKDQKIYIAGEPASSETRINKREQTPL
jgi:hypothetical protein